MKIKKWSVSLMSIICLFLGFALASLVLAKFSFFFVFIFAALCGSAGGGIVAPLWKFVLISVANTVGTFLALSHDTDGWDRFVLPIFILLIYWLFYNPVSGYMAARVRKIRRTVGDMSEKYK